MRIIVKDRCASLYLNPDESWGSEPSVARVFPSIISALQYCVKNGLTGTGIVLSTPRDDCAIRLSHALSTLAELEVARLTGIQGFNAPAESSRAGQDSCAA